MRWHRYGLTLGTLLLTTLAVQAQGQNPTVGSKPSTRPTVSPFVNLRRAGTPAINYFGIVRPQLEFRERVGQLQERLLQDEATTESTGRGGAADLPPTGQGATFFNYSHFFPSLTSGSTSGIRRLSSSGSSSASGRSSVRR